MFTLHPEEHTKFYYSQTSIEVKANWYFLGPSENLGRSSKQVQLTKCKYLISDCLAHLSYCKWKSVKLLPFQVSCLGNKILKKITELL